MLACWGGLAAGALHAVGGPDHLAALGPLSVRHPVAGTGARVGASWGAGHGAGLLGLALLVLGARLTLPLSSLSLGGELLVGMLLVAMGLGALRDASDTAAPAHARGHAHGSAFAMGLLHGATGAGHVLGVLPSVGLSGPEAAIYLSAYALSAAVSMSFVGRLLGELSQRARPTTRARLRRGCAGAAVMVGLLWTARALWLGA